IDRLHTSLGSIFFSRSTNDGTSFSTEEIVNNTFPFTENNINPYLCEVKTNLVVGMDAEKNSAATWEARDGNNIIIMYAQRQTLNGYGTWDAHLPQYSAKSFNVDATGNSNFQSLPKISAIGGSDNSYFTVSSYLKPVGSTVKLMARICNGIYLRGEYEVSSGNISDFAISSTLGTIGNGTSIHYAYKKDNNIFYKNIQFYVYDPTYGVTVSYPETNISTGDANTSRFSPDISVRRGSTAGSYLPIVTYQGITPLTRVYSIDEVSASPGLTETRTVQFTQYPIMVTYMMSPTTGWSNPTAQPSSGTIVQSDPNIEGSATGNGYILSFRKGNSGYYQYSNIQNYHCEPPSFLGTDAKLVKGSYSTPLGGALLTTLTNENQFYKLGKQNVSITNVNSQVQDGVYGNIKGVVNMNDIDYVFNMGPIFVATGPQVDMPLFGDSFNEVTPITGIEFNEYLRSEPFTLNNGDTLILGATANYIAVDKQDFYPMKYTVNLMNANTQEVSRVLFSDTIHIEDEEMTEYYRGFVFSDLNPEDGNVYLQIMVEDVSNTDAKYNYVGIYQGESEVQDRSGRSDPTNGVFVDFGHGRNPSNVLTVKPTTYSLAQNFPNPFNPSTTIQYSVPNDGLVQMRIYDISGREVMNLVNENKVAGNYEVKFNGANLSSGIYFYRIKAGEFVETKRMVLVK
ncbi:MAG: T9SS type A sorting domain-containing protein, partial [Ignavibacteria bacterium]|nr:T9SS type A sorting domain-containing protein [Ignavibacteria bacterium]